MNPHSILIDVIVRPEYRVRYEQVGDVTFCHVDVSRWGHQVARRFLNDIDTAHALLGRPVYVLAPHETHLLHKFLGRHGFAPCGECFDNQGRVVPVFGRPYGDSALRRWCAA